MKTKITLLTISAALLLTACGQVQSSPTETPLTLSPAVQEETRQPQPQRMNRTQYRLQRRSNHKKKIPIRRKSRRKPLIPLNRLRDHQRKFPPRPSTPKQNMLSQSLHKNLNRYPHHLHPQTVKRPSTLPTPMRPHNTVSPRTQVWHWITASTASQPQYRWMPRRKHWKPRRETW